MQNDIYGLMYIYDQESDTTSVSWAYSDSAELEYFILETYDEVKRQWMPFDGVMGIIQKDDVL